MTNEHQEENAALYVFDLLEGHALANFETELTQHSALRTLVYQFHATSTQLALTAEPTTPSPALRERIRRGLLKLRSTLAPPS